MCHATTPHYLCTISIIRRILQHSKHTLFHCAHKCFGYLVRNGKRDRGAALITAAGNFLDLMKKVVSVGSDLDWEYRTIACPSILFSSCAIAGE